MNKEPKITNDYDLRIKEDGLICDKDGFLFTGTFYGASGPRISHRHSESRI